MKLKEAQWRHDVANEEVHRLDAALVLRTRDCEELRRSSALALQEAHKHAWELEEALAEVQRRMAGSEARVRQMQAHLLGMREKLAEEFGVQLAEARAELRLTQEQLDQSWKETRQHQERNVMLEQEVLRLKKDLTSKGKDARVLHADFETLKAQRIETTSKEMQTTSQWKPGLSKFTMTEISADIIQQEMDKISIEEHEALRRSLSTRLELSEHQAQNALLKQQQTAQENENLLTELQEQRSELDVLQEALHSRFVPISCLQEKDRELVELRLKLKQMQQNSLNHNQEDSWKEQSPKIT